MDSVFIEGLRLDCVIGVYGWEREVRQELYLDAEMAWPVSIPGASDDVADALDYARVAERLQIVAAERQARLLEALVEALPQTLQEEFGVSWLRLRLRKPGAVPAADSVGVCIERGERPQ